MSNSDKRNPDRKQDGKDPKFFIILKYYILPLLFLMVLAALIVLLVINIGGCTGPDNPSSSGTTTTAPTTETTEATTEETVPQSEIDTAAQKLITQAEAFAVEYDYDKAISLLSAFEHIDRSPAVQEKLNAYQTEKAKLVKYEKMDTITHVFFHSLIVDTNRAFDGGSSSAGYNQWMTTVAEFKAMMEEMYKRGFVLITPYQMAGEVTDASGNTSFQYLDIYLPEGKKPFIMSQDDLNYYGYMICGKSGVNSTPQFASKKGDGFAHKIIIGEDGKPTCEYMDAQGNIHVGDYDLVPILETFIQEHPGFAYRGARAVLGVTGYEGVFGYRTKPSYEAALGATRYAEEVANAKAVAQCLKDNGWIIASHSYGHPRYGSIGAARVEKDSDKWENTVQPIVGNADIILFPHGDDIEKLSKPYTMSNGSFKALYEDGYRYFFNVDSSDYWNQLGTNYFRGGRRNLDGYRMWYHPYKLDDLFDAKLIFDKARPTPVPQV